MNKKIGFVAGCWDGPSGLHNGHLYLLKTARELCDYLIVAGQKICFKQSQEKLIVV